MASPQVEAGFGEPFETSGLQRSVSQAGRFIMQIKKR
jgi:hypothetical protein